MTERLLQFEIIRQALVFYRRRISVLIVSSAMLGLVGYASDETVGLFYVALFAAVFMVTSFHTLFGGKCMFFNVVLANAITIYLCLYTFFVDSLFQDLPPLYITAGFLLPLGAFLGGALFKKNEIQEIIHSQVYIKEAKFIRSFLWLIPIALISVTAFILHQSHENTPQHLRLFFLMEMSAVSAVVFLASRDFTLMLIDTGSLFSDFFASNAKLIKPIFAFLTFYFMNIIIFAGIYKAIDRLSQVHHFMIHSEARDLTFIEAAYFSLTTISTLGYGDIVPITNVLRFIVGLQMILGTVLLFFGVHAMLAHKRSDSPPG